MINDNGINDDCFDYDNFYDADFYVLKSSMQLTIFLR